ncbi:hypothetical protein Tco_0023241, partial [Tanacetum coccineum]
TYKLDDVDDVAEQVNIAGEVNTAGEEVNTVSEINIGSIKLNTGIEQAVGEDKGQREGKAPMLSEETPKKSKDLQVVSEPPRGLYTRLNIDQNLLFHQIK